MGVAHTKVVSKLPGQLQWQKPSEILWADSLSFQSDWHTSLLCDDLTCLLLLGHGFLVAHTQ